MLYRQLCICDDEPVYLNRLAAYLGRSSDFMWQIRTCTQSSACLRAGAEALLISGSAYVSCSKDIQAGLRAAFGARMILLDDDTEFDGKKELVSIPKYGSAMVLRERLDELLGSRQGRQTMVTCMYVPGNGPAAEKNGIRYLMARPEAEKKLLISLTEYTLYGEANETAPGLREWFYADETGCADARDLQAYALSDNGCEVIRGFRSYYDMVEISLAQWQHFFNEALKKGYYRQICLAFDRLPFYPELFGWCDQIYAVWGEDAYAELKQKQFIQEMNYIDMPQIADRVESWNITEDEGQMMGAETS